MSDIFREVEEDLRRERIKGVWQRYGLYIIAVALIIVLGTAGWRGWEYWQASRAASLGDQYDAALQMAETGQSAEADAALRELAQGSSGYAVLARFRIAGQHAATGESEQAIADYDALAGDRGISPVLRDMARVQAGYLLVDTASDADVRERVEALADGNNPWRHAAREVLGLSAWKAGDMERAAGFFQEAAADGEAPAGLRTRADLMLEVIAGQSDVDVEPTPAPPAAAQVPAPEEAAPAADEAPEIPPQEETTQ